MEQEKTNNQDDNDSGYSGEEEALYILKKKRTKAQDRYRKANAAVIPNFIPPEEREAADYVLKETQVYTPYHGIEEQQVQKFIYLAARYAFDEEQALAILHSNRYQLEKARADLKMFAPLPSQWPRDKSVFIHAFKQESKYFYAIKDKFFPNRPVADMVQYYYTWKMEKKKRKRRNELRKAQLLRLEMQMKKTCPQINTEVAA